MGVYDDVLRSLQTRGGNFPLRGVFVSKIRRLGNVNIEVVTLVDNRPNDLDSCDEYAVLPSNAVFFQVRKGDSLRVIKTGDELRTWLEANVEAHTEMPVISIDKEKDTQPSGRKLPLKIRKLIKRNKEIAPKVQNSGAFLTDMGELGALCVKMVTLINHTPDSPYYKDDYEEAPSDGVVYEVIKNMESRLFFSGDALRIWLEKNAATHFEDRDLSLHE